MPTGVYKRKFPNWNKGGSIAPEIKKRMSLAAKKAGVGKWMLGRQLSPEHIKNIIKSISGKKNHGWKGGIMS